MTVHRLFSKFVRVDAVPRIRPCFIGLGGEVLMGVRANKSNWINKIFAYVKDPEGDGWRPIYKSSDGKDIYVDTGTRIAYKVDISSCLTVVSYPPRHADALSTMA